MTKKQWFLVGVALVFAVLFIHHLAGWFKPKMIQISYTERPLMSRARGALPMILFGFEGQSYRLSEIEVVPLAAWQTNHSTAPVWHLTAESRSAPVQYFVYGQNIPGMNPASPGALPEPLETNITYRLLLRAGFAKGQCDFQLGDRPAAIPK
jgi:hypothetical protein